MNTSASSSTFGAFASKPHVIFTLVDDWGWELWPRRNALGDVHAQLLPQLRRTFVDEGVTLARHYTYSYCAPSRQSLLSGRLPLHVNEENSVCAGIPRGMSTIGDVMKRAGYSTHYVGKWHAGFGDPSATPSQRGFDSTIGFFMKAHHHFSHCSYLGFEFAVKEHHECRSAPSNRSAPLHDFFVGSVASGDAALGSAHPIVKERTYSTHAFMSEARRRILEHDTTTTSEGEDARPGPLFLFISLSAVHKPFLAPPSLMQRAGLAHPPRYYRDCEWVQGSQAKCRTKHRKGYEAMALAVDDGFQVLREALLAKAMWHSTLLIFASDNGGPIGPQASNVPLRGGKDTSLEGGVRTLAALGGGWVPRPLWGATSHAFMHESDWMATLAHTAGVDPTDRRAASAGLPPVDSVNLWRSWTRLGGSTTSSSPSAAVTEDIGDARTIVLATRFGLPGTPAGGTSALLAVHPALVEAPRAGEAPAGAASPTPSTAFKYILGVVCECPECRPCLQCNTTGCVFDVLSDPGETHDLGPERPELLRELSATLHNAMATKFVDKDPINQECWEHPKSDPNHWMEVALARGATMQPWLKTPSKRMGKPRVLYPHLLKHQHGAGR